ncbi:M48 family metallopeptidase [Cellvibrio mixtus]|uniref:M48 family metallopeptidase n=1 Tax=Cellvibrio mixtus TaxID=39650 RepID=UPI00058681A4|nr:M48 family metallopeptidase [Cellvibrio mixtus]
MNFFEHQDRARRNTRYLIFLLIAAVFSLVAITTLLFATLAYFGQEDRNETTQTVWQGIIHSINPVTFLWIASGVSIVVLLGSLFRFVQLRGGGKSVAEAMGGRLLAGNTQDADERKILNVVEEMAIASGTAVPPVYLIEEESINAFAAGYHLQDAVIGITRGCIQSLSRDELQGVIAHEFSHVFHGDMRINMRLISLLYGILVIGLIGEFLIRISGNRSVSRSNSKDNSPAALLALGVGLLVIGYTGIFFGNLIKSAVSRQREFLADASAVQFTRNPEGIAGALKKIGGSSYGSELKNEHAAEFSHMYFGQGVKSFFNLMATHPPLEERIKRIQPSWNGEFSESVYIRRKTSEANETDAAIKEELLEVVSAFDGNVVTKAVNETATQTSIDIEQTLTQIAQPTQGQIGYARARLAEIPEPLKIAARESFSARAIIFGLLLDRHAQTAQHQLALLSEHLPENEFQQLRPLISTASSQHAGLRLPLIELCLPALKQLSPDQHNGFLECMNVLISADKKISLMEWALHRIVLHNNYQVPSFDHNRNLQQLPDECGILLSTLAHAGATNPGAAQNAFARAQAELGFTIELLPKDKTRLVDLDKALDQLNRVKPLQKPQLLKAMSQCVLQDNRVTIAEAELFRAIADSLDCPVPPLVLTAG